jgi:hypothetical protein
LRWLLEANGSCVAAPAIANPNPRSLNAGAVWQFAPLIGLRLFVFLRLLNDSEQSRE